jgi:hypothetical protein
MLAVRGVQDANVRTVDDKTYHLIISFPAQDKPTAEQLASVERRFCEALGYGEHQRISAVHHDTDNIHIHVAINKIHPTRLTIHTPKRDFRTLGETCAALETEFGFTPVNHRTRKRAGESRATDMEMAAGIESLIGWVRRTCADQIHQAQSWHELHSVMSAHGLQLHARGNGLVITAENGVTIKASSVARSLSKSALEKRLGSFEPGPGEDAVDARREPDSERIHRALESDDDGGTRRTHSKAADVTHLIDWIRRTSLDDISTADSWETFHTILSDHGLRLIKRGTWLGVAAVHGVTASADAITPDLTLSALEQRFGSFAPRADAPEDRKYEPRPVPLPFDTTALYAAYQVDLVDRRAVRAEALALTWKKRAAGIEAVKRAGRLRRALIKAAGGDRATQRLNYRLASRATRRAIEKIVAAHAAEVQRIKGERPYVRWNDWLQSQAKAGNDQALAALRARRSPDHGATDGIGHKSATSIARGNVRGIDHVTKSGTIIYRNGEATVRDDGKRLHVTRGTKDAGAAFALAVARQHYGEVLSIEGSAGLCQTNVASEAGG